MYFLVYVSAATMAFSHEELVALLASSRKNNSAADVSGMLLYKDGNFMQVLEGKKDTVLALYNKINLDPRHKGVIKLLDGERDMRCFPEWSMGFHDLNNEELKNLPGFTDFLSTRLRPEEFSDNPDRCLTLLLSFKKSMR